MRIASCIISLCLHATVFLLIWFWPPPTPLKLDAPPIMISLVDGAPGGNMTPSPILGHMGDSSDGPLAPAPPAPQSEIAAPAQEKVIAPEAPKSVEPAQELPKKPEAIPVPEKKPEVVSEPVKEEVKVEAPPKPEPAKPVPAKPEPKKPEPKKPEPKKPEQKPAPKKTPPKVDPVQAALQQARKATSRANSGDRGNAIEQALAQARRNAGGNRGGGGGQGDGPGGGGLGDVYIGQIMTAVRPNWGFASGGRKSLLCVVKVEVDMQGRVLEAVISQSSGNAQYDASAVNAVIRTGQSGQFPPPPNPQYMNLDLVFTLDEMMGR